jgi:uncharacterized RDD family membrane protein YckC
MAAAIDVGIAFILAIAIGLTFLVLRLVIGSVAGYGTVYFLIHRLLTLVLFGVQLGYILGRDVYGGGRSLGKKTQDIRVLTASGAPLTIVDSVKRNAIFSLGAAMAFIVAILGVIPCLGAALGCLLSPLIILGGLLSLAAAVVELVKIIQDPDGIRVGDQMAGTRVMR